MYLIGLRSRMSGELRWDSNTSDLIFFVAQIISSSGQYMTLDQGDITITRTHEGVMFGLEEKVWLPPGVEITAEVGNLERVTNRLIKED